MTDIDFRRIAALLYSLRLVGTSQDPIKDAVALADKLLEEIRQREDDRPFL